MPVEFNIWRIDGQATRLAPVPMDNEARLEGLLARDVQFLGLGVMIIGRQVITAYGKRIDLLAIDAQGNLCVIEIKRDRTPREIVAQLLDYGSWIRTLTYEDILNAFATVSPTEPFEQAFENRFGMNPPEALNESHRLIIVASELDNATERIVTYLSTYGVPINALFFRYFKDGDREYLARTWLIDPKEAEVLISTSANVKRNQEVWNGQDFYVAVGEGMSRTWDDCVNYGFVSGGGGRWYSKTLEMLTPNARVFACIPNKGYVGVGIVTEAAQRVRGFTVEIDETKMPILQAPVKAPNMGENAEDPELSEYLVRIEWIKTLPVNGAIWEKGMYANQNTVTRLRNKFTLERLIERFGLAEVDS